VIDRRSGLGASDSPIVYGCSPFMRPLQLWRLKMGLDEPEEPTEVMEEGNFWETYIREAAEVEYHRGFPPALVQPEGWHWSQLDGMSDGPGGTGTILECKFTRLGAKELAANPPMHWKVQIAHQIHDYMAVYGKRPSVLLATGDGIGYWFGVVEIEDELIARVYSADQAFWRLVQAGTPPVDTAHRDDAEWQRAAAQYLEWKEAEDQAKAEVEIARGALQELANGAGYVYGHGVQARWKSRAGGLDYAEMEADGIDLSKYRKEGTMYWEVRRG
jgi:predicted phage-related endonuclease